MIMKNLYVIKRPITLLLLLPFSVFQLYAQPISDYGSLSIKGFYSNKLQKINILTNASLQIRTFILHGNKVFKETKVFPMDSKHSQKELINKDVPLKIPSHNDGPRTQESPEYETNARVSIVYQMNTMIIDFEGILNRQLFGIPDEIDSVVIQPGYFKYVLHPFQDDKYVFWKINPEYKKRVD